MSERVLVTGASGFLGRHLVTRLAAQGDSVTGIDIAAPEMPLPCEFYRSRVEDYLSTLGINHRFDTVFHLAAIVGGRTVIEGSPLHIARNLELDRAVYDYIAQVRTTRLVYPSSSAVYPLHLQEGEGVRALEESDVDFHTGRRFGVPDNTYGWVKLTGEFTASIVRQHVAAPIVVYRPFSVYGPGQAEAYPVTAIARRVLALANPLEVWGSGQQVRDFVHIEDFLRIVLGTYRGDGARPLNISSGQPVSFALLAATMAEIRGYKPVIEARGEMPSGVSYRVGSSSSIPANLLPRVTLTEGLRSVLDWLDE